MNTRDTVPEWFQIVYWLATEVGKRIDKKIEVRQTKRGLFGFRAPKNFAYIRNMESATTIRIDTKKEWADKAGVTHRADRYTEGGWWGEPDVSWQVAINNTVRLREVVGILAKIWQARHR